ncbi:MAG TPA: phosphate ABC transporter substrate-binding protein PstS [Thermoplasmata archaeon]|nr:phosphate ABC transporter substrate-binding protein PstS [Thermoplasmata archaeon]
MNDNRPEEAREGSGIRRPRRSGMGKLSLFGIGLAVGALLGAGVYAAVVPRTTSSAWCSVNRSVTLTGAGATFPFPLIDKWRVEYNRKCPNVQINYQSIGSGGGIAQITANTVDFGASDAPLNAAQRAAAPGLAHIPETIGAVVLAYRIPNVPGGLNLTGPVIAEIFLGNITYWDDPQLTVLNPQTALTHELIFVVHRSDGSGTTFVFTDYLSKVSPAWAVGPGKGTSVNWPVGLGAKGNEGVAGVVQGNAYSIGYVELAYGIIQRMTFGTVQNAAGNFILPSLNATQAAAAAATPLPAGNESWQDVSITDAPGAGSYPISSLTYILLYVAQSDGAKGKVLVDFLWWAIHDGQQYAAALQYVPLPANIVALDEDTLHAVTHNGTPLLAG